jgi:hypothetical protein
MIRNIRDYCATLIKKYPWLPHVLVAASFILFIFYYMTPQVLHCSTTVYGFGDNTAGPIWRHDVSPSSPFWGPEKVTNFPFGETLASPVNYSGTIQYVFYWVLANLAGSVCGYNFLNFIGLFVSAFIMYGFIYALTRKKWIAWLSGYAVTFSPYFQMKIGGHPSYAYQALLIGSIWLFVSLIREQTWKYAVGLGLAVAASFYFDPYFVLLELIVMVPLGLAWLALNARHLFLKVSTASTRTTRKQLKLLLLALATSIVLIMPLAAIKIIKSQEINSFVSSSRGNVLFEAKACSNLPHEYFLPFALHPVFGALLGKDRYANTLNFLADGYSCGIGEDSVGLSLTLVFVVVVGGIIFVWEKANRRTLQLHRLLLFDYRLVIYGLLAVGVFAFAIGFPPVNYHGIPSPSYELLKITSTWRTLTRVYVVVNIVLVTMFAIIASYFSAYFKARKIMLACALAVIFIGVAIEYQAFSPFSGNKLSNFNYSTNPPVAYKWLGTQKSIKSIVEYPLEREGGESDAEAYYLSMQTTHHKNMLNSALPASPQDNLRYSIKDLSDPQTVPILHSLGIDTVVVHGVPEKEIAKIPYLSVVYTAPQSQYNLLAYTPLVKHDNIVIAKITGAPSVSSMMVLNEEEFPRNTTIIHSSIDWSYEALKDSVIKTRSIKAGKSIGDAVCFDVKTSLQKDNDTLMLIVDGKPQKSIQINDKYQTIRITASDSVKLHNLRGHNMQVRNLGCPAY